MTHFLLKEVGKKNIKVNSLYPVIVPTNGLLEALDQPYYQAYGEVVGFINNFKNTQATLPKYTSGEQIGKTCMFLASKNSSAITGQCINVNCGVFP
jgi:enoyl-[acyl-carrier-protein] reductase (NADH)